MSTEPNAWALPRLQHLLPLDTDSLKQIIDYAATLSKDAAAEHLKNLLGDSPDALDFISLFNSRRSQPVGTSDSHPASQPADNGVPIARPGRQKKAKPNIHALPARQVDGGGDTSGAYVKRDEQDYMTGAAAKHKPKSTALASALTLSSKPEVVPASPRTTLTPSPSASSPVSSSPRPSRTSSPAPKAKVNIAGGTSMSLSTTLSDLDAAIRSLELQTNPTLASDPSARACNCMATLHPLQAAAPNCLSCGQIICLKQGLGPCVSCGTPLLSADDLSSMIRLLKDERGRERQAQGNIAHRRAEVATKPRPFSGRGFLSAKSSDPPLPSPLKADEDAVRAAQAHRDKLLSFQAHNAQRTTVHDEAADYALPVLDAAGTGLRVGNAWASPAERALEVKRAQRALREFEFNARPEWERRRVVASIDVVKGKVVKRFVEEKFEDHETERADDDEGTAQEEEPVATGKGGAFSRNPLLGKLIRPVFAAQGQPDKRPARQTWRRVQDDLDNEEVILDGGTRGFGTELNS